MNKAAVVLVLAALTALAAAVRGRSREELPAPARKPAAAPVAVRKGTPAASADPSATGTLAFRLLAASREQRELRNRMMTVPLGEAERSRLLVLDAEVPEQERSLSKLVRGNPDAWRDVLVILSACDDPGSARGVAEKLRGAVDPAAEALWTGVLLTAARPEDRRLSLAALADRGTPSVILALTVAAQEDSDGGVRADALTALARVRHQPMSTELSRMVQETLSRRKAEDQDAAVRERASLLVQEIRRESAPRSRRSPFSR